WSGQRRSRSLPHPTPCLSAAAFATAPPAGSAITGFELLPLATPLIVIGLSITACSREMPGHTWMVLPGGTPCTASVIESKLTRLGRQLPTATVAAYARVAASGPSRRHTRSRELTHRFIAASFCYVEPILNTRARDHPAHVSRWEW